MKLGKSNGGRRGLRFRSKVVLSYLIVIGLAAVIMGLAYYRIMSGELKRSTLDRMERLTGQTVGTLDLHLRSAGVIGLSYFSDISLQKFLDGTPSFDDQQYYRNKLEGQRTQNPLISSVTIKRLDGEQFSSVYYYDPKLRSLMADELERLSALAREHDGTPLWTVSLTTMRNSLVPVKTISYVQELKRITSSSQHPVGLLKIDLDPAVLRSTMQSLSDEYGGDYYIADAEGGIVFAQDAERIGGRLGGRPLFKGYREASPQSGTVSFRYEENNRTYLGFARKLNEVGWVVLAYSPMDSITGKVKAFGQSVILIAVVSFLAAMLVASVLSAGVTRPLKVLNKKMKQVEMGDFAATIEVKGDDELAIIQHSFNKMTAEIRLLISKVYETELLKRETEIKALQTQLNPHFLYNTLGTIDSIASINGEQRVGFICQALGSMLRYNLNGGSFATVKEELDHLDQYLSIYTIRFAGEFEYAIAVEPGLEQMALPKFLMQPLVENAVIHGLEQKLGSKRLTIDLRSDGSGRLVIAVTDNGVGMDEETLAFVRRRLSQSASLPLDPSRERTFIGLSNIFRRIEMHYGSKPLADIASRPGEGTRITLLLPMDIDRREQA